jgi:hypothetical protein
MGAEPTRHSSLDILRQAARLDFAGTTLVAVQRALSLYFNGGEYEAVEQQICHF